MTNADKIRSMADEELAQFIVNVYLSCPDGEYDCSRPWFHCVDCWKEWLVKEVDE